MTDEEFRKARNRAAREAGASRKRAQQQRSPRPAPRESRPSALATAPPVLLSRDDLRTFFGVRYSRTHLWRLVRDGKFPAPVAFGPEPAARKAWRREVVEAYVKRLNKFNYGAPHSAA